MTRRYGQRRSGNAILEAALLIPLLIYLLIGMVEFARIGWTYFTLQKILYNYARFAGTRPGVNLCDDTDTQLTQAKTFAITGGLDASGDPILPNLTADTLQLRLERVDSTTGDVEECGCSADACDVASGGRGPDFIGARLSDGYSVTLRIPLLSTDPVILRPQVRVPYGSL